MAPNLASGSYTAQGGVRISEGVRELSVPTRQLLFYVAGKAGVNGIADLGGRTSLARIEEEDAPASDGVVQARASQKEW
jgi:hypothetical protein